MHPRAPLRAPTNRTPSPATAAITHGIEEIHEATSNKTPSPAAGIHDCGEDHEATTSRTPSPAAAQPALVPPNGAAAHGTAAILAASTDGTNVRASASSEGLNAADTCWMILSAALVLLMVPALGFFEAGLLRNTSSVSILSQVLFGFALLSLLWWAIGFSIAFGSPVLGGLLGNPAEFLFLGRLASQMHPQQSK